LAAKTAASALVLMASAACADQTTDDARAPGGVVGLGVQR
jgi:hypothetical protein